MNQLDMFTENSAGYLYGEIQKNKHSTDRMGRALLVLITEMQDQLLKMQEKDLTVPKGA